VQAQVHVQSALDRAGLHHCTATSPPMRDLFLAARKPCSGQCSRSQRSARLRAVRRPARSPK
jgi:hypothetical protein